MRNDIEIKYNDEEELNVVYLIFICAEREGKKPRTIKIIQLIV